MQNSHTRVELNTDPPLQWCRARRELTGDALRVVLSEREAELFERLVAASGAPVSRRELAGANDIEPSRTIDYAIRRIRKKVETNPTHPTVVQSVHGVGYRLGVADTPTLPHSGHDGQRLLLTDRSVDLNTGIVHRTGGRTTLTALQLSLLRRLIQADGTTVSRMVLLRDVWGSVVARQRRLVDSGIRQLRTLLEVSPARPVHLLTERGAGYRLFVPSRLSNLPTPLWDGISRPETDALSTLVGSHRWVTVVGPPGSGKSWLAHRVAVRLRESLPGGAWWVDAVDCSTAQDVARSIADVLDVPMHTVSKDGAELLAALAGRPERLVVVDGLPPSVHASTLLFALASHSSMRLLVTSVKAPDSSDSHIFVVPELSVQAARALFLAKLRGAGSHSEPDGAAVDRVCAAMRFNPRAIDLAARRAADHGLTSTAQLVHGDAIRSMVSESLHGTTPEARDALIALGLFETAFTLADATAVADVPESVITALVARQLLVRSRPGWLRVYPLARDTLPDSDLATRDRHAAHIRALFAAERSQFRTHGGDAAQRRCRTRLRDGLVAAKWYIDTEDRSPVVDLLLAMVECTGDAADDAFRLLEQALQGPPFAGRHRLWLTYAQNRRIDVSEAERALASAVREGADPNSFRARVARVLIDDRKNRLRVIDLGTEPTTPSERIDWLIAMGRSHAQDDVEQAMRWLGQARSLASQHGDSLGALQADYALAHGWAASMRSPQTAAAHFARLKPRFLTQGRMNGAVACAFLGADMWLETGEREAALEALDWVDEMAAHLPVVRAMAYPELIRLRALADEMEPTELVERSIAGAVTQIERGERHFASNFQILTRIAWARLGDLQAATAPVDWTDGHTDIDMIFEALCCAVTPARPIPAPSPEHWPVAQALVRAVHGGTGNGTPVVDAIAALARTHRL